MTHPDLDLPCRECTRTLYPCSMASSMKASIMLTALYLLSKIYDIVEIRSAPFRSSSQRGTALRTSRTGWALSSQPCWLCGSLCCSQWSQCPNWQTEYFGRALIPHVEPVLDLHRAWHVVHVGLCCWSIQRRVAIHLLLSNIANRPRSFNYQID